MNRNTDISPEEFEIIERYILKQMPQKEYEAFTSKLLNDESLQNKTESVKLLLTGIQEVSLEEKMEDFHKEITFKKNNKKQSEGKLISMKRWMIAASVIVVAALGLLLFFNSNKQEKVFASYYKPDPGLISPMGTSENYVFDKAMIDYKTKNYDSAIKAWEELLISKPGNDTLNYFLGSAYLAKGKSDKAIPYFQKVLSDKNSYFLKDANWYLGLALIKEDKIKEAIPFIEKSENEKKESLLLKLNK